jgi:hypothetical protein
MVMVRPELAAIVSRTDPDGAALWAEFDDSRNAGAHGCCNSFGGQSINDDLKG